MEDEVYRVIVGPFYVSAESSISNISSEVMVPLSLTFFSCRLCGDGDLYRVCL